MKHTAQTLPSPRIVKVLGADPRLASNDEDEINRGPITLPVELYEEPQEPDFDAMRREGW